MLNLNNEYDRKSNNNQLYNKKLIICFVGLPARGKVII
jgi:hypothetical protein